MSGRRGRHQRWQRAAFFHEDGGGLTRCGGHRRGQSHARGKRASVGLGTDATPEAPQPTPRSTDRWPLLTAALLRRSGRLADLDVVLRRRVWAPMNTPSLCEIQRWRHLHGAHGECVEQRRAELLREPPPYELTLAHQLQFAAMLHGCRRAQRLQWCWRSLAGSWLNRLFHQKREDALREARRHIDRHSPLLPGPAVVAWRSCRSWGARAATLSGIGAPARWDSGVRSQGRGLGQDWPIGVPVEERNLHLAAQLGLDEATYRLLLELEARDILPEDYELLGRLDESVRPATLDSSLLNLFPTETYRPPPLAALLGCIGAARFGVDFWRPPLPVLLLADEHGESQDVCTCGMDLPLPAVDLEVAVAGERATPGEECRGEDAQRECGVCLLDFEVGDELRTLLPCGHRFHRGCIDRWLLESSTTCPVDKRDLLQGG